MAVDRKFINDIDLQDAYKAKNAIDPTDDQDYVTKAYGDANYGGGGPPSGSAGGVLDGTYPDPGLAAGVAGAGLAETSDVLSVNVDGTTIEINTDTLRVKSGVFDAAGAAAAAQAASQPLDSDLTALADLSAATGKTTPVDADLLPVADSAASFAIKKLTWAKLKETLKTYFDTLYVSGGIGAEVAYVEFTSTVSIVNTTEAGATTVVTAGAFTADGTSAYLIEFYSPQARPDTGAALRALSIWLYEDGSSIGEIGHVIQPAAANDSKPTKCERRMIPASGSRTYSIRCSVSAGTGAVVGGAGGTGTVMPGFIRITKVT